MLEVAAPLERRYLGSSRFQRRGRAVVEERKGNFEESRRKRWILELEFL